MLPTHKRTAISAPGIDLIIFRSVTMVASAPLEITVVRTRWIGHSDTKTLQCTFDLLSARNIGVYVSCMFKWSYKTFTSLNKKQTAFVESSRAIVVPVGVNQVENHKSIAKSRVK